VTGERQPGGEEREPGRADRDRTPPAATGTPGEPALWVRTVEGAEPDIGRKPFLYRDTGYAGGEGREAGTGGKGREGPVGRQGGGAARASGPPEAATPVNGPFIQPPVWTWEVPLYFWLGGIAAGASFVALGCDLAGDARSARRARMLTVAAVVPCPPLLISDLGRPERFHHMLRVFKPRSPMNMGAWALTAFGALGAGAVAADVSGRPRVARRLGAVNAVVGAYVGSYTGVLLSTTAVPLWSRSRLFLGPVFVATAVATGAAAVRFALGGAAPASTQDALARIETGAMAAELALSAINERRLGGDVARPLRSGSAGRLFRGAKWAVRAGLALRAVGGARRGVARQAGGALFLGAGLAFRYAWVDAGKRSAADDETVARVAREGSGPR
jgi:formate-dependent nitrite reductase membrane component NrfD